jgi:hypothetical protein
MAALDEYRSKDEGVGLEEGVLQSFEDGHLLHLRHPVLLQVVHVDAVGDVAEDKGQAVLVDKDLEVGAGVTEVADRFQLHAQALLILDSLVEVDVEAEHLLDVAVGTAAEQVDGVGVDHWRHRFHRQLELGLQLHPPVFGGDVDLDLV